MSGNPHWDIQPKWVKALSIGVGLPAWLVLMYSVLSENGFSNPWVMRVAFAAFATVAVVQFLFIARGYWRMDI